MTKVQEPYNLTHNYGIGHKENNSKSFGTLLDDTDDYCHYNNRQTAEFNTSRFRVFTRGYIQ